jgi:hypothetical protein
MLAIVILGDLVPDGLLGGIVADMKDGDVRFGVSGRRQRGEASRGKRELAKIHGFPPKGSGLGGVLFVRDADKICPEFGRLSRQTTGNSRKIDAGRLTGRRGIENNSASRRKDAP